MSRYPLRSEFRPLEHFHPPVSRPLLPAVNCVIRLTQRAGAVPQGMGRAGAHIPVSSGTIPAEIVRAASGRGRPALVYYHGGGFIMEAAAYHYRLVRRYARESGCVAVMPRYRLAPQHPYPVPVEDALAAYLWVRAHAGQLGVDPDRIAVGGDSAGGTLAAAVCLLARDRGLPMPCFQLLVYPATDSRMLTLSMARYADTPMWDADANRRAWALYIPDEARHTEPYAAPLCAASLAGLPPAYLETARYDCLHDEGVSYARALENAGVPVTLVETEGTMHGFDIFERSPYVQKIVAGRTDALRAAFAQPQQEAQPE